MRQRRCQRIKWMPFKWIHDNGAPFRMHTRNAQEINAATNAYIIIERMLRRGRGELH